MCFLNGARQQVGNGTSESSDAPNRPRKGERPGKGKNNTGPRNSGVDKDRDAMDPAKRAEHAKKMDALYKVENALPNGRYFHKQTPFCTGSNCTMKVCQGCGAHQVEGKPWHDRPRCNCRRHPDFVATGYFHDKWPGRLSIHARPSDQSQGHDKTSQPQAADRPRTNFAARSNTVSENKDEQ